MSLGFNRRFMKHVGMNLRLRKNESFMLSHSSKGRGFANAVRNSVFKPFWGVARFHALSFNHHRLDSDMETLKKLTFQGQYSNKKVVGNDFEVVENYNGN